MSDTTKPKYCLGLISDDRKFEKTEAEGVTAIVAPGNMTGTRAYTIIHNSDQTAVSVSATFSDSKVRYINPDLSVSSSAGLKKVSDPILAAVVQRMVEARKICGNDIKWSDQEVFDVIRWIENLPVPAMPKTLSASLNTPNVR